MRFKQNIRTWGVSTLALASMAGLATSASAEIFDVAGRALLFNETGPATGTGLNAYRDYRDVITIDGKRIDARVTITELNGATVTTFDSTANPYSSGAFLQPTLEIASGGGYATFRVDFFDQNGQPATLQNFYVNTYDLDGAGAAAAGRQFTDFSGFASYALSTGTKVTAQAITGGTRFITTVGGNLNYTPGADDFNTIRARVYYTSASSVTIKIGDAKAGGLAYFGLDFSVGYAFNNVLADTVAPVVTAGQFFFYPENRAAGGKVAQVVATDAVGVTAFRFSETDTATSADGYYTIDNAGAVRLTAAGVAAGVAQNDFDILPNSFTYGIVALDAAGNRSTAVDITLNVLAAPPRITGPSGGLGAETSAISVNENQTAVTTMAADRAVTWSIAAGADAGRFIIDGGSGELTFVAAPDYEAPGDADANNVYVVTVSAVDAGGRVSSQTVSVTVLDVPDNPPVIAAPGGVAGAATSSVSVNENQTGVMTLSANVPVTWSIGGGADAAKFAIEPATGVLTFVAAPDYEAPADADTNNIYVVVVSAQDTDGRASTQTVSVTVLDVADNPPVISVPGGTAGSAAASVAVNENQTGVITLTASPAATWSLTGGADVAKFSIDSATGTIIFRTAPDFEAPTDVDTDNVYVVEVTATGSNGLTSVQTLSVTVLNLPEPAPVVTGPGGSASSAVSLPENRAAVTALAADRTVVWSIAGGADSAEFIIDASTGAISFVSPPDFEAPTDADGDNVYVVVVRARDANNETVDHTLSVTVLNESEPVPVITGPASGTGAGAATVTVNENQTAVTVYGSDRPVRWSIIGGADAAWFTIDPMTGAVAFRNAPDYEAEADANKDNVYEVEVAATDANNETAVQTLHVVLQDVIDTSPVISGPDGLTVEGNAAFTVAEGQTAVTHFASSRPVEWRISGGADAGLFVVDANGDMTFASAPDYEAPADADRDNVYRVELTATDEYDLSAVVAVSVTVQDVDDTAPVITGPDGVAGAVSSLMPLPEGQVEVTTFTADEAVIWSLAGGTDQDHFVIDGTSGALTFAKAPSFEAPSDSDKDNDYVLVVRASDAEGNTSEHTLTVRITDVDEVAPRIAAIATELRADLRNHAFNSLGDMLAYNEAIFRDFGDCEASAAQGKVTPTMHADAFSQGSALAWDKTHCTQRFRIIGNAGAAIDHADGDWTRRGLASVRIETEVADDVTVGAGLMGSFADNDLASFEDSAISDRTLQVNLYVKANVTETLRAGAFAGFGKAWYDFELHQTGFDLTGEMSGRRTVYGAMLSGDVEVGSVLLTTDLIVSHATEALGQATLQGSVSDDTRTVLFDIGDVDMTRVSVPVTGEFKLWGSDPKGWQSRLRLSPGLLCEDRSADASALTCGYQFGGRLVADREGYGSGYIDYRIEAVDRRTRNLIGVGYQQSFGPRKNLEWNVDVATGVTDGRPDSRAMVTFRARP